MERDEQAVADVEVDCLRKAGRLTQAILRGTDGRSAAAVMPAGCSRALMGDGQQNQCPRNPVSAARLLRGTSRILELVVQVDV